MISHDAKVIFVHIPKCAGRSIVDVFNQRFDHYVAQYYAAAFPQQFAAYSKFTIVRNPYERLVSLFVYLSEHRRHRFEPIMKETECFWSGATLQESFTAWLTRNLTEIRMQGHHHMFDSYKHFSLKWAECSRGTDGDLGSPFWFSSQASRIYVDLTTAPLVDKVFKLEDGMQHVATWLESLPAWPSGHSKIDIGHTNVSDTTNWQGYFEDATLKGMLRNFAPLVRDCRQFGYELL